MTSFPAEVEAPPKRPGLKEILALHNAAITELRGDFAEQQAEFEILRAEVDHLNAANAYCETCGSSPCVNPQFCQFSSNMDKERARQPAAAAPRPTPQVTVEAIVHCVRERGISDLQEPINQERLSRCDVAAREQVNARIEKLNARIEKLKLSGNVR